LCMIMLVFCICLSFGSTLHIWEKTWGLCLSEPGLIHLTWCPAIASTFKPHTSLYFWVYSLFNSNDASRSHRIIIPEKLWKSHNSFIVVSYGMY
jgi:hypothetical protein